MEKALVRYHQAIATGYAAIAVLDVKGAYYSVLRDQLLTILHQRLPTQLVHMIALLLRPETIQRIGDPTHTIGKTRCVVTQGSPMSLYLFNIYV